MNNHLKEIRGKFLVALVLFAVGLGYVAAPTQVYAVEETEASETEEETPLSAETESDASANSTETENPSEEPEAESTAAEETRQTSEEDSDSEDTAQTTEDTSVNEPSTTSASESASEQESQSEGASNEKWPGGVALTNPEETGVVMDVDSGALLYSYGGDIRHYPASITKVMTAMLAIENGNLDDIVTFSKEAVYGIERGSAHIARDVGEEMPLRDCLYGMMLESANECAYAIAEHIGGDFDTFIEMMNEKAKELGCKNTHFCNPNGLFDEEHYTTAYDMALIARAAYENETFDEIVGTKNYTIPPTNIHEEETYLNNHHAMLNYYKTKRYLYEYCVGGKTGYTTEANNTLVTYAKKDGQTLVCVILNAEQGCHYNDTTRLFEYCFEHFNNYSVDEEMASVRLTMIDGAEAFSVDMNEARLAAGATVTLPAGVAFSEAAKKLVSYGDTGDDLVIGALEFAYADHGAGQAEVLFEKAKIIEEEGGAPAEIVVHRRFEKAVKWFLPTLGGAAVFILLLLIQHVYTRAPYHRYYGSRLLRRHFRRKRKKNRRRRRRAARDE